MGVTLSSNGLFYQAQKALANQSLKSVFALNSIFDTVALETTDKIKLFDSLLAPILNYSSEVWGFHDANDVESANVSGVIINDIVQRIKDQYIQNWFSQLENYAKLDIYRTFKSTFEPEKYITCLNNRCHFYSLARFR